MALSPVASDIDRWSVASRVSPGTVSVTMVNGSRRPAYKKKFHRPEPSLNF
jgi:hypothetical protein